MGNFKSIFKVNANSYNLLVVFFVGLSTLSTAYGLSIIGSTVGQPNFYDYFNLARQGEPGYGHTTNLIGALNGANSAGGFLGCLVAAWTSDRFSRIRTIMAGCAFLAVGGAINAGSVSIVMFSLGRLITGIGSGLLAVAVPIYQGEVATAENRSLMMGATGITFGIGYSLAGWLGYACAYIPGSTSYASFAWRFPLSFQCVPPLLVLLGGKFLPFSPRWLLSQDRRDEAFAVIKRLHRDKSDPHDVVARQEYYLMEKQFESDNALSLRSHRFQMFKTKANRRRALVGMLLMTFDQLAGVYVLTNYGVLIYASLGLKGTIPLLLNACWNSLATIGNTWGAFNVDKYGRRRFFLIGITGCWMCLIFLAALTGRYLGTTNNSGLSAAVFFIWLYVVFWAFFMDATQFVYVSEIWPNHLRAMGTAWGFVWYFLFSVVMLVAAPVALNEIGWEFYLLCVSSTTVYIGIIYFLFPETKERTLEEIGIQFGDENVASRWYDLNEADKAQITQEALERTTKLGNYKIEHIEIK